MMLYRGQTLSARREALDQAVKEWETDPKLIALEQHEDELWKRRNARRKREDIREYKSLLAILDQLDWLLIEKPTIRNWQDVYSQLNQAIADGLEDYVGPGWVDEELGNILALAMQTSLEALIGAVVGFLRADNDDLRIQWAERVADVCCLIRVISEPGWPDKGPVGLQLALSSRLNLTLGSRLLLKLRRAILREEEAWAKWTHRQVPVETVEDYQPEPSEEEVKEEIVQSPSSGFVYLVRAEGIEPTLYKIGMTTQEPEERVYNLQTMSPVDVTLVHYIDTGYVSWTERALHKRFKKCRVRGEWFQLSPEDVEWMCSVTAVIQRNGKLIYLRENRTSGDGQEGRANERRPEKEDFQKHARPDESAQDRQA